MDCVFEHKFTNLRLSYTQVDYLLICWLHWNLLKGIREKGGQQMHAALFSVAFFKLENHI